MRIKPFLTVMSASGFGGIAYSFTEKLKSFLPSFGGENSQNQTPIPNKPLALTTLTRFAAPKIDLSSDRRDLSSKNLSLEDLQQLDAEVQNNPFIGHIIWGTLPSGEVAHNLRTRIEQKIIQNNVQYQRYPSDFLHGVLSLHSYQTVKDLDIPVTFKKEEYQHYEPHLAQWRINSVHDLPEWGQYYAASYYNKDARQLVLAHRGTTATWSDLWNKDSPLKTDLLGVLAGEIIDQQKAAYTVTKETATFAQENNYHFSTTGHSLGAWLAELSLYYSVFDFKVPAKAVTFDSPGSIKMEDFHSSIMSHEESRDIRDLEIETYLSEPNLVNTCHRHVGQVYRLYPQYEKPKIPGNKILKFLNHPGFQSIWGHSLGPLVATFDPKTGKPYPDKVKKMASWPVMTYTPSDKIAHNIITNASGRADNQHQQWLVSSLMNLVGDVWGGRINQKQYLACWEHLSNPLPNTATPNEIAMQEFAFKYESSYEFSLTHRLSSDQLLHHRKGSADWYLKKLQECAIEKIEQHFGEDSLITQQLIALKKQYTVAVESEHYRLTATGNITVEVIRERILRLLSEHVTQTEVKTFLETHQQKPWIKPPELQLASYLPIALGDQYILRTDDFGQIDQILAHHPYAIICGEPGFGKSSLAMEYGHRQESRPQNNSVVFTIAADSPEKIDAAYRTMATQLGIRTEKENAETIRLLVHSQIYSSKKKVLLIFDNVENSEHIEPFLTYLTQNIHALITTRHSRLIEGKPVVKVRPFSHQEAKRYIYSSDIKARIGNEQEVDALITYYAKGTDQVIPYHLNRAIGMIKQKPIGGINNYLSFIKAHPDDEGEVLLQQRLMAKSKLAWPMLQYAAFLDPDFIDLSIFEQILDVDRDSLVEAIQTLESLSAMYVLRRSDQEGLSLHRLTQVLVKGFIDKPSHQAICIAKTQIQEQLAQSLNTLFSQIDSAPNQDWQRAKRLMPHIEMILNQTSDMNTQLIAELSSKNANYMSRVLGLYSKAHEYYKRACSIWQKLYPDPEQLNTELANALHELGRSYNRFGGSDNEKEALKLLERALTMRQALYPNQPHPDVALSLNNVGDAYYKLGGTENTQKGLNLLEQALTMMQKLYPDRDHPDVATYLSNVGNAYYKLGGTENTQKGLNLLEQALTMMQKLYPNQDHPHVARSLNNVGDAYCNLGGTENTQTGLALLERALKMRQTLYPNQPHPDVAHILNNMGIAYENLGGTENVKIGLALTEQALTMRQKLYPKQAHPDVARSLNNVGIAHAKLGGTENMQKGLALQVQALTMTKELYPNQPHPDLATSLNNVGNAYEKLGGVENAKKGLELKEQALAMRQKLYPDQAHSDVAQSLNDVGLSYAHSRGVENRKKGLLFQEQALAMRQKLYPEQAHPDIAISLNNIGIAYGNLDGIENKKKGLDLQKKALTMRQTLYPDQVHLDVVQSLKNIGNLSIQLGQKEEGQDYLRQAEEMQQKLEQKPL